MDQTTEIPARYNGPPTSGNGGYSCGLLAGYINGPARVRLHSPPPLDTPLQVVTTQTGVEMYDGDSLVASGVPATLELDIPAAPYLADAEAAMARFPCYEGHSFPTCFVCGPQRSCHDGLELFPGSIGDDGVMACIWRPAEDMLDARGIIRDEILWSALDCPGYFAAMGEDLRPALLGELTAELPSEVAGDQPLVVFAWPLGVDGRKFFAGTAIATAAGEVVACSRSIWIHLQ